MMDNFRLREQIIDVQKSNLPRYMKKEIINELITQEEEVKK